MFIKTLLVCLFVTYLSFSQTQRPNVLFMIADDAGIDMSAYGSSYVNTPGFDEIAKNGILFQKAYTSNAKCAPSRASLLTGRNPWQLDAACNHNIYFPPKFKTFPEVLEAAGYKMGQTGKVYGPGLMLKEDGSQRLIMGKKYDSLRCMPPFKGISEIDYSANFNSFLKSNSESQPWCFWIGFLEPHRSFEFKSGQKSGKKTSDIKEFPAYLPDVDSVRNDLLDYGVEIEYMDSHIVKVLQMLKDADQLENTIIVITSDHGMPFPRVKGNPYEHANHVPLAIMWPKGIKNPGRKENSYISLIDLAPTFLDAANIKQNTSEMQTITGESIMSVFDNKTNTKLKNYVLIGQERHDIGRPADEGYPIRGIYQNNFLYIKNYEPSRWPACNPETGYLNTDGGISKTYILHQRRYKNQKKYWQMSFGKRLSEEFYDIDKDPDCVNNLAKNPAFQTQINALKLLMIKQLTTQGDLRMTGLGYLYEKYQTHENVNFYERYMKGEKLKTLWVNPDDYEKKPIED